MLLKPYSPCAPFESLQVQSTSTSLFRLGNSILSHLNNLWEAAVKDYNAAKTYTLSVFWLKGKRAADTQLVSVKQNEVKKFLYLGKKFYCVVLL